jgi:Transmembrane secretion effector
MSRAPLRLPAFRRLLFAYGVGQLGDWAGEVALAVAVLAITGSPAAVAATWVVHRCLFGLLTPALVARLEHRSFGRLVPGLLLAEAAIFLVLAAAVTGGAGLALILPLVALDGVLSPATRALARTALVRVTAPADLLREGNALVNTVFTVNGVLAPALGGVMVALLTPAAVLAVDAASFVLAAAALARCRLPRVGVEPAAHEPGFARVREALGYVRRRAVLRGLLGGEVVMTAFLAAIVPVEVVFVTETLGGSEAAFGAVLTSWGLGMVLGGVAGARVPHVPVPAILLVGGVAQAVGCLGMGLSGTLTAVLIWSAVGGLGNGLYSLAHLTAVQERTGDAFQARVNALYEAVMCVGPGVGFALGGALAALLSPRAVYVVAAAGCGVVLLWAAARLRHADWSVATAYAPS